MYTLTSIESFRVTGYTAYIIENPETCDNFDHLMNTKVSIDGRLRLISRIERFAHMPPYYTGERIGLLVA